jgi:hypothetical protein
MLACSVWENLVRLVFREIALGWDYYAASIGNILPTFRDNVSVFFFLELLTVGDGTDTLSRNVGKQLPHDAAA